MAPILPNSIKDKLLEIAANKSKLVRLGCEYIPPLIKAVHNPYHAEPSLERGRSSRPTEASSIDLHTLMTSFEGGQLSFIGPAGSGKTTLLNNAAKKVIDGSYENMKKVELIIFVEFRLHTFRTRKITGRDLIFHSITSEMNPEAATEAIRYAESYPNKALFFLDSLDSLEFDVRKTDDHVKYEEENIPEKHLGNFLAGKYLDGCRIITSGRDYSIRSFTQELQPSKVVALVGLTTDAIRHIIFSRFGKPNAKEIWQRLSKCPALMSLCSSPACLQYTLCGIDSSENKDISTMTNILMKVLEKLHKSLGNGDDLSGEIFKGLESLSLSGMKTKRVAFTQADLEKYGLTEKTPDQLVIPTPWSGEFRFMRKDSDYLFTHKSLQETFAALATAELPIHDFKFLVPEVVNQSAFSMVRRILHGVVECENVERTFLTVPNMMEKRQILLDNISDLLSSRDARCHSQEILEIYYCLYESGNGAKDVIVSSVKNVTLHDIPISPSDAYIIGSVMAQASQLEHVAFWNCSITNDTLKTIERCLEGKNVKISTFGIHNNSGLSPEGLKSMGNISNHCALNAITLQGCDISASHIRALNSTLKMIKNFIIWEEKRASYEDVSAAMELFSKISTYIGLDLWTVTEQDKRRIQSRLNNLNGTVLQVNIFPEGLLGKQSESADIPTKVAKLGKYRKPLTRLNPEERNDREVMKRIEIFGNDSAAYSFELSHIRLSETNSEMLVKAMLTKERIDLLKLRSCLRENSLHNLYQKLLTNEIQTCPEIREVNVSCNSYLGASDASALGNMLQLCSTTGVDVSEMKWGENGFRALLDTMKDTIKLRILKCNHNPIRTKEAAIVLSGIVSIGHVEELHLAECDLRKDSLVEMKNAFLGSDLKVLNLSYNRNMSSEGYETIGKILKNSHVQDLLLRACNMKGDEIKSLAAGMKGTKLRMLDLCFNTELQVEDMHPIGKFVVSSLIENLYLAGCELDLEKIMELHRASAGAKITLLDISDNLSLGEECVGTLTKFKKDCAIQELKSNNCGLDKEVAALLFQTHKQSKTKVDDY